MGKLLDEFLKTASEETAENTPPEEGAPEASDVEKQAADLLAQGQLLGMGFNAELSKEGSPLNGLAGMIDNLTKEALNVSSVTSAFKQVPGILKAAPGQVAGAAKAAPGAALSAVKAAPGHIASGAGKAADAAGAGVKKLFGNIQGHNAQAMSSAGKLVPAGKGLRMRAAGKQFVGRHERGVGAATLLAGAGGAGYAGHKIAAGSKTATMLIHIANGEEDFTKEAFLPDGSKPDSSKEDSVEKKASVEKKSFLPNSILGLGDVAVVPEPAPELQTKIAQILAGAGSQEEPPPVSKLDAVFNPNREDAASA